MLVTHCHDLPMVLPVLLQLWNVMVSYEGANGLAHGHNLELAFDLVLNLKSFCESFILAPFTG